MSIGETFSAALSTSTTRLLHDGNRVSDPYRYEQVRDGEAAPTIGETIAASRAMNAIERERLLADLDEERRRVLLLMPSFRRPPLMPSGP